jgi:rhodanese-related sulfurtransferase
MVHKQHSPGFLALVDDAKSRIRQIDIEAYKKMVGSGVAHTLIDVREESEFAANHAANATHMGKGIIERDIETAIPAKDQTLVLYCGGGYRSALAADAIQKMGYTSVYSLDGGWRAIEASGLPLAR